MAKTACQKILSAHAGKCLDPGEIAIVDVDGVMSHDAGTAHIIQAFYAMGGNQLWNPQRVTLVIDHASPAPNKHISNLHQMMRDFATKAGCRLFDVGEGICHQLIVEHNLVQSGEVFLGGDSHSPTYGALGAFAIGVGSTDIAGVWLTGKTWLQVPHSRLVTLEGRLSSGVFSKDIILSLMGNIGMAEAAYQAIEFTGKALDLMNLSDRMTLTNMVGDVGAKTGIIPTPNSPWQSDSDAQYTAFHHIDLDILTPQISLPHSPDQVVSVERVEGKKVHTAFIGSCTNGNLQDLQVASKILNGKKVKIPLIVAPASRTIFTQAIQDGSVEILSKSGATFLPAGCGPCGGTHMGVPADGKAVISSANRNFRGRMGNPDAEIYLSSPATVAASALTGEITDPRQFFEN